MQLLDIRDFLTQRRLAIRRLFDQGAPGLHVGSAIGDMVDEVLRRLYAHCLSGLDAATQAVVRNDLAVVAIGGYGRQEQAPYSDVDLLLLHGDRTAKSVLPFTKQFVRNIWDVGLPLGQNVTTVGAAVSLAKAEVLPATALLEPRLLIGSEPLLIRLQERLRRLFRWGHTGPFYHQAVAAIRDEHAKFGSTVHLLEPDVKRSSGGLRDLHLLRWLGAALHELPDPALLEDRGFLEAGESRTLKAAQEFLARVRADLHFHAGKTADSLVRSEQVRIAQHWGYRDGPSLLAVEQFMRDYFRHTTAIADIVGRFVERVEPHVAFHRLRDLLSTRQAAPGVRIGRRRLSVARHTRSAVAADLGRTLEIAELAARHGVDLDRKTLDAMRRNFTGGNGNNGPLPLPAVRRFFDLLARPGSIHRVVRRLHEVGVLERLIPEFEHARCLLQFNAYHKYTVDEHTFVMLESAEALAGAETLLGRTYRSIARKDLLHLAILLHDLGKGFTEDHSELGAKIAATVAGRFQLNDEDRDTVVFLVRRHLLMSTYAFHRDTGDRRLQLQLMRELGSAEVLQMLYVLTAVDVMAVGPGTFNQWKADLLAELYLAVLRLFGIEEAPDGAKPRPLAAREQLLREHGGNDRSRRHIESLPDAYLKETSLDQVVAHLLQWRMLPAGEVATLTEYHPAKGTITYTVLTDERITEGLFSKIVGALSSHHLDILAARIHTLADGSVIDQFDVADVHHAGPPSPERCKLIGTTIKRVLTGALNVADILWSNRTSVYTLKQRVVPREATRIVVDNHTSEKYTVIDVFTVNRRGLLYTLAKGIYRLGLSVQLAKIATYEDEVIDVFYVQEFDGKKVGRDDRVRMIQSHLNSDVQRLATDPRSMGF